jgi:hypothetical protein
MQIIIVGQHKANIRCFIMTNPVQSATNFITQKLDSTGWFNTVTHGETKAATDRLQSLSAPNADAVVDNLARSGQLNTLAREVLDGNIIPGQGGLSTSDRQAFFADMAKKLDGNSLAALHNSFTNAAGNGSTEGLTRGQELASAIAAHASPQAKLDFIRAMAPSTTDQQSVSTRGFMNSSSVRADPQAAAVGTVLGSLRGSSAQLGFSALSPDQMRSVMTASTMPTSQNNTSVSEYGASSYTNISWNAGGFGKIMDAAASMPVNSNTADLRARIFDAGADTLRGVRETNGGPLRIGAGVNDKDKTLADMTGGLTRLLNSDVRGTVSELNLNRETRDGSDLGTYAQQMLDQGKEKDLGSMLRSLGDYGNTDRFMTQLNQTRSTPDGGSIRPNAEALGYFVGAVTMGARAQTDNIQQQRDSAALILKFAAIAGDKATGPIAGGAITAAGEFINPAMRALIADPTADAGRVMEMGALPVDQRGEPAVGQNVSDAFDGAINRVLRTARP